ncbi:MAG: GGDEF domain-containing protein [Treponema sp.]|nr:GGDEF domain-containing protein [Candidatus Treponema merdequi]
MAADMVRDIIQHNYSSILFFLFLVVFVSTNRTFNRSVIWNFLGAAFFTILLTVSDNIRFYSAKLSSPDIYRYLSAACGYSLRPLILFFLALVTSRNFKKNVFYLILPAAVNALISFISIPTGIMFSFTSANRFVHGPLGYLCHVTSLFYMIYILHYLLKQFKSNRIECLVISVIMFSAFIAAFLEHLKLFDLILSQTMGIGIVFYFLLLNVQVYKRDTLTQLLNRRCFYLDLSRLKNRKVVILSMDLNNLKKINDGFGHAAGDAAINTTVECMLAVFYKCARVYRTGGDEFMAIFKKMNLEQARIKVEEFTKKLSQTQFRVACGLAEFNPGDNFEKVISLSDAEMYKHKKFLKELEG